jgi:hypothetical protein
MLLDNIRKKHNSRHHHLANTLWRSIARLLYSGADAVIWGLALPHLSTFVLSSYSCPSQPFPTVYTVFLLPLQLFHKITTHPYLTFSLHGSGIALEIF